jgi:hypothetical protein
MLIEILYFLNILMVNLLNLLIDDFINGGADMTAGYG